MTHHDSTDTVSDGSCRVHEWSARLSGLHCVRCGERITEEDSTVPFFDSGDTCRLFWVLRDSEWLMVDPCNRWSDGRCERQPLEFELSPT